MARLRLKYTRLSCLLVACRVHADIVWLPLLIVATANSAGQLLLLIVATANTPAPPGHWSQLPPGGLGRQLKEGMLSAKEGGREPQCTKSAVPARFLAETTQGSAGKSVAHATLLKVSGIIFCLTCGPAQLGVLQPAAPHALPITH